MAINNQPIEKRPADSEQAKGNRLDVQSIFWTIQGEGPFCGTPAVFVRLAGCNLQCPACDTDYTSQRRIMYVKEITQEIQKLAIPATYLVVITGGEPFRQNIYPLVKELMATDLYVQVETNGILGPSNIPDQLMLEDMVSDDLDERKGLYIVCSPKTGKVNASIRELACCFKYVLTNHSVDPEDGLPIHVLDHNLGSLRVARPPKYFTKPIYLQPADEKDTVRNTLNLEACIASCRKYGYILQTQVHKVIGLP